MREFKTRSQSTPTAPSQILTRKCSSSADVVKSGHLHIKRPPSNIKIRLKTWQKRLLVLRDDAKTRQARLEVYNTESDEVKEKTERLEIDLQDIHAVDEYKNSKSFPNAFVVTRRGQSSLIFGVETEGCMREWLVAIRLLSGKERNPERDKMLALAAQLPRDRRHSANTSYDSYRGSQSPMAGHRDIFELFDTKRDRSCDRGHLVQVQPTKSANDNTLHGNYMMRVGEKSVFLRPTQSVEDVITWPLVHILKFKAEPLPNDQVGDLVTLEAGPQCHVAEGVFMFKTNRGKELIADVNRAKVSAKKQSSGSQPDIENIMEKLRNSPGLRQSPPKLPLGKCESVPNLPMRMRPSLSSQGSEDGRGSPVPSPRPREGSNEYLPIIHDEQSDTFIIEEPSTTTENSDTVEPEIVNSNLSVISSEATCTTKYGISSMATTKVTQEDEPPNDSGLATDPPSVPPVPLLTRKDSGYCDISDLPTPPTPPPRPRHTLNGQGVIIKGNANNAATRPLPPLPPR